MYREKNTERTRQHTNARLHHASPVPPIYYDPQKGQLFQLGEAEPSLPVSRITQRKPEVPNEQGLSNTATHVSGSKGSPIRRVLRVNHSVQCWRRSGSS